MYRCRTDFSSFWLYYPVQPSCFKTTMTILENMVKPSGRACFREFNVLIKQLAKRRRCYLRDPLKIWTSPRVIRAFFEWLQQADSETICTSASRLGVLVIGLRASGSNRE